MGREGGNKGNKNLDFKVNFVYLRWFFDVFVKVVIIFSYKVCLERMI